MPSPWRTKDRSGRNRHERGAPSTGLVSVWRVCLGPDAIAELRRRHQRGESPEALASELGAHVSTVRLVLEAWPC